MEKITNFKIIDKKTIELLSDAKKGDQIDLSIKQSIDFSNLDEQIRNEQSSLLKQELEQQENKLKNQFELEKRNLTEKLNAQLENKYISDKNKLQFEIEKLKNDIERLKQENQQACSQVKKDCENEFKLEKTQLNSQIHELNSCIKSKDDIIKSKDDIIKSKEKEKEEAIISKQKEYEKTLALEIEKITRARSFSNSKQVGEDLEKWCDQAFEEYQTAGAFENCKWSKINLAIDHEKADYIFKVFSSSEDNDENLLTSVCCEMKNEQENVNASSKKHNSDHYKKLDRNRNSENAEYALLISTLDKDDNFLIKKVKDYKNMYVVRPQYFITFLALIAQVNKSFGSKIQELKNDKNKIDNICALKVDIEKRINDLKESVIDTNLPKITKKIQVINESAESILESAESISNKANEIRESTRIILNTHLKSLENKINDFTWKKFLSNVEKINKLENSEIFQNQENVDTFSDIAYCKTKK